ncbi:MAG: FAD-dependent monooxygenase [Chromatiales bacterium]|nr:FAD-dependent monooxygenase [Chromatiales bacterium]
MVKQLHVIVVGAGLGGLTATLALQRAGVRVSVYEQAAALGEAGAGVTITPNGVHVLNHLLGADVVGRVARTPAAGAIKHYRTGAILVETNRGNRMQEQYGAAYCQAHRADLHGALADAVRAMDPGCIHPGCSFGALTENGDGITATFRNGVSATGDLLIGCDGIRSAVRRALWGDEQVSFTGYIAWRGLVPMDRLDPGVIVPDSASFAGPARTFARYKVRGGTLVNYAAFSKRDEWAEESWSVHSEIAELQREFSDFAPEVQAIIAATPPERCFKWGLFDREPLGQWTRGRATLLGDAAHPMTPFLAQGAVMAIEDGMVLARALEAAADWREGLARYEAARRERGTFVMRESHVNARRMYSRDPDNYGSSSHKTAESLGLYAYNPLTVPV